MKINNLHWMQVALRRPSMLKIRKENWPFGIQQVRNDIMHWMLCITEVLQVPLLFTMLLMRILSEKSNHGSRSSKSISVRMCPNLLQETRLICQTGPFPRKKLKLMHNLLVLNTCIPVPRLVKMSIKSLMISLSKWYKQVHLHKLQLKSELVAESRDQDSKLMVWKTSTLT